MLGHKSTSDVDKVSMVHSIDLCYLQDYIYHIFMDMFSHLFSEAGLSLDRLRAFCQIAESGGFTKAAGGDATKQPLLSRQVKELEGFFGVELLRRAGRGVVLTDQGRKLHALVRDYFGALADFKSGCAAQPMDLQIGAGDSVIQWLILPTLATIRRHLPEVQLKLLNLPTQEVVEKVSSGEIEFGVVRRDAGTSLLKSVDLGPMPFGLFVPKTFLTAGEKTPWKEALRRCPLAVLEGTGSYRKELKRVAEEEKITLKIEVECSSFPAVAKAMVSANLGGILPAGASSELAGGKFTQLKALWVGRLERNMTLIWSPRVATIRDKIETAAQILAGVWRA